MIEVMQKKSEGEYLTCIIYVLSLLLILSGIATRKANVIELLVSWSHLGTKEHTFSKSI